VNRTIFLQPV